MKLAIAIPMKPLPAAKSRLRPALEPRARQRLARTMLEHVMQVAQASQVATSMGVISADGHLLQQVGRFGFEPVLESVATGYNQAVQTAITWTQSKTCEALLILPSDLPWLLPEDVQQMARLGALCRRSVVIAPDAAYRGTNALLLRPPHILAPAFGPDSARQHRQLARARGISVIIHSSPTLSHDIDLPEDLERWRTINKVIATTHGTDFADFSLLLRSSG